MLPSFGQIDRKITALDLYKAFLRYHNLTRNAAPWTPEEDQIILREVDKLGEDNWIQVAYNLVGRDSTEIQTRYFKFLKNKISYGKWKLREDVKLLILVEFLNEKWCDIEKKFDNRTQVQIRERWCNLLNPELKNLVWT